jgi:hypothetical protein
LPLQRETIASGIIHSSREHVSIQLIAPTKRDLLFMQLLALGRICFHSINCPYKERQRRILKKLVDIIIVSIQLIAPTKRDAIALGILSKQATKVSIQLIAPTKRDDTITALSAHRQIGATSTFPFN